jgi:MFS family permease
MQQIRAAGVGTLGALTALMVAQSLMQIAYSSAQQLVVLRLLSILHSGAEAVTGTAFGAAGLASGAAGVCYSWVAHRSGYRRLAVVAGLVMGGAIVGTGITGRASVVVALFGLMGLVYGAVAPAISSMIGLEAPPAMQGRIFGIASSSISVGFALGPFFGGSVAATAGIPVALAATGAFMVGMSVVLLAGAREPRQDDAELP